MFMEKKRAFQMRKEKEESMTEQSIPPNMYLGHVHLKVANLERALTEVMGVELVCTNCPHPCGSRRSRTPAAHPDL